MGTSVDSTAVSPPGPEPVLPGVAGGPVAAAGPDASRSWAVLLVCGVLATGVYYLLPTAGVTQAVVLCGLDAVAAAATMLGAMRSRGRSRMVWTALSVGLVLGTVANIPYYSYPLVTGRPVPDPSVLDALWLLAVPCFFVALLTLVRHRRGGDSVGHLLDAAVIIVGGGTLMWVFALSPAVDLIGAVWWPDILSVLYPVMDLLVFAMLVLLLADTQRNAALRLLVAGCMALLLADLLAAFQVANDTYHVGGPSDGLWMLSYLLVGAAAMHPTARAFPHSPAVTTKRISYGRLTFLGGALLVGPGLLAARTEEVVLVACSSVVSFLLVMARMTWLNRRLATARQHVESKTEELRHQALHDALTGLPNRALITDRIEHLLARNRRSGTFGAALYVDLDGFKNVNDTLGHAVGDELLQAVSARMTGALRDADTIGRMGGDEFVVLVDGSARESAPEFLAERLLEVMRKPFVVDGAAAPLVVTASIGIAIGNPEVAGDLLRDADTALYRAKAAGRNCYEIFRPEMGDEVKHRYEIELDLRGALAGDQFRLVYQPIYNLEDLRLVGVEALIRWAHPTLGVLQPDDFVPLLESSGHIVEVGRWVLREACAQMAAWRAAGSELGISVNVSARQLDRELIVDHVREALADSGLPPAALTLEVTETTLMRNIDVTADHLRALKALGVLVAIDDFGTGYSSLAYLQRLPVDSLKIDRAFTDAISRSPESDALVHTLVQLGKDLGLRTLAEGVESLAQVDHLRGEGVDEAQGFLLARPLDAATFQAKLLNSADNLPTHQ